MGLGLGLRTRWEARPGTGRPLTPSPSPGTQVKEYDSISRLDQWLTTMLLRIKKTIQGDEEDLR